MLRALRIPYRRLEDPAQVEERIGKAEALALSANKPIALLLCRDLTWEE